MDVSTPCQVCGSTLCAAEVTFSREVLTAETVWHPVASLGQASLCEDCAGWFGELMQTAAVGQGDTRGRLGIPTRSSAARTAENGCDYCHSGLGGVAFAVDVVPFTAGGAARGPRRALPIRHQRLCGYCAAWLQSVMYDPSAMLGQSDRRDEGPMGVWRSVQVSNVATCRLGTMDNLVVATTIGANGLTPVEVDAARMPDALQAGHVGFMGAGGREAERLVRRLAPNLLAKLAVVAHVDGLDDAFAAMRAGAADFLASPLSPQQVAGSVDRLMSGVPQTERGPLLGLPVYRGPIRDGYGTALPIVVRLLKPEHAPMAALLLRRFVRGYDRVGEDGERNLRALIYCPADHLPFVVGRLTPLMADVARVSVAG